MYDYFKSLNFWKTKRKLFRIDELISRMKADAIIKNRRLDNLISSTKILNYKINDPEQYTNPFIPTDTTGTVGGTTGDEGGTTGDEGGTTGAPSIDCYIIVHGHNPEGKEIGSISGFNSAVEIFDGFTAIGYANGITRITISSGYHSISVHFNGITLSQEIDIVGGETQDLIFTFARTVLTTTDWVWWIPPDTNNGRDDTTVNIPPQSFTEWFYQYYQIKDPDPSVHNGFGWWFNTFTPTFIHRHGGGHNSNGYFCDKVTAQATLEKVGNGTISFGFHSWGEDYEMGYIFSLTKLNFSSVPYTNEDLP